MWICKCYFVSNKITDAELYVNMQGLSNRKTLEYVNVIL
jgi:hypothetical protein